MIDPVLKTDNELIGRPIVEADNQLIGAITPTGTLVASVVSVGGGGSGVKQVYRGSNEPTNPEILIWIDTSIPPITGTQLITSDNKGFYTSDNEAFILREETKSQLITSDNKMFITADDKEFILNENEVNTLLTLDNKEFIESNNKKFILKEEY